MLRHALDIRAAIIYFANRLEKILSPSGGEEAVSGGNGAGAGANTCGKFRWTEQQLSQVLILNYVPCLAASLSAVLDMAPLALLLKDLLYELDESLANQIQSLQDSMEFLLESSFVDDVCRQV